MQRLLIPIELTLQVAFSWTIAFDFCLLFNLPAWFIFIPFLILFGVLLYWFLPDWRDSLRHSNPERGFILGVLALGLCAGLCTLVISRPTADDHNYYQPALAQTRHIDQPFFKDDVTMNVPGIPRTFLVYF